MALRRLAATWTRRAAPVRLLRTRGVERDAEIQRLTAERAQKTAARRSQLDSAAEGVGMPTFKELAEQRARAFVDDGQLEDDGRARSSDEELHDGEDGEFYKEDVQLTPSDVELDDDEAEREDTAAAEDEYVQRMRRALDEVRRVEEALTDADEPPKPRPVPWDLFSMKLPVVVQHHPLLEKYSDQRDIFKYTNNMFIDYRNTRMLSLFLTEGGAILSRKYTGLSAKNQRKVTKAIKRARVLGLLPYMGKDTRTSVFEPYEEFPEDMNKDKFWGGSEDDEEEMEEHFAEDGEQTLPVDPSELFDAVPAVRGFGSYDNSSKSTGGAGAGSTGAVGEVPSASFDRGQKR